MNKTEYEFHIATEKVRMEKGYLTRSEREKIKHMIENPKLYVVDEPKKLEVKKIITDLSILNIPCEEITKEDNLTQIITDLRNTLEVFAHRAIGLSANQIGYNKRVSVLRIPTKIDQKTKKIDYNEIVLINAKITNKMDKIKFENEGCLSFPGVHVTTERYIHCSVQFLNEKLEQQTALFSDIESLAAQHEIGHQNGETMFDHKWSDINRRSN